MKVFADFARGRKPLTPPQDEGSNQPLKKTTMAERNATEKPQPLPQKIEKRLAELVQMGEFGQGDVNHCRRAYWSARDDWHKILIDCYDEAKRKQTTEPP